MEGSIKATSPIHRRITMFSCLCWFLGGANTTSVSQTGYGGSSLITVLENK